jgi:hypothetical protein
VTLTGKLVSLTSKLVLLTSSKLLLLLVLLLLELLLRLHRGDKTRNTQGQTGCYGYTIRNYNILVVIFSKLSKGDIFISFSSSCILKVKNSMELYKNKGI